MKRLFSCVVCICVNLRQSPGNSRLGCGGPVRAFFPVHYGCAELAQVANDQGLAKTFKNPRFSLDLPRLYAKIVRVKIGRTGADGGGMKTGSHSAGGLVFPAALRHSRPGPGKSAAFCRKLRYGAQM